MQNSLGVSKEVDGHHLETLLVQQTWHQTGSMGQSFLRVIAKRVVINHSEGQALWVDSRQHPGSHTWDIHTHTHTPEL